MNVTDKFAKVRDLQAQELVIVARRLAVVQARERDVEIAKLRLQEAEASRDDVLRALSGGARDVLVRDNALWEKADA